MTSVRDLLSTWLSHAPLRRCTRVGDGAQLEGAPAIANAGEIILGRRVRIRSVPIRTHLATGPGGRIRIGDDVQLAHGVSICSHAEITIDAGTILGPFAIVLDVDFHEIGDRTSTGQARPIQVGRNVRISAGAVILRGAVIEDDVVVGPNSVVSRRIPRGTHVVGIPARPRAEA